MEIGNGNGDMASKTETLILESEMNENKSVCISGGRLGIFGINVDDHETFVCLVLDSWSFYILFFIDLETIIIIVIRKFKRQKIYFV